MITLDQALDTVMQLPPDQQEMLIDIVHSRHIRQRRREIADDAQASLAAFRQGLVKSQSVSDIVFELRQVLDDESL